MLPQPPHPLRKRILIVEDDLLICRVVETVLSRAGFEVLSAHSAEEALQKVSSVDSLDLCIADFRLPGASGLQLTESLTARYPSMKVIYASGYPMEELPLKARIPGNATFIGKPFKTSDVLKLVQSTLSQN